MSAAALHQNRTRSDQLAALRAELTLAQEDRGPALPFGIDALDDRLADSGLDGAGLHEIAAASSALSDDAAATLFAAGIAARFAAGPGLTMLWALTRFDLYAPGLEQVGLGPDRILYAQGSKDADVLAMAEDVLAIPAIDLTHGRRERALARTAFSRRLPAMLIDRRGKGDLTLYFGRMLAGSTVFLREFLLDGLLAAHEVIDHAALEAILTPDTLMTQDHYSELLTTIIMERWARGWAERLGSADGQGDDASVTHALPAGSK